MESSEGLVGGGPIQEQEEMELAKFMKSKQKIIFKMCHTRTTKKLTHSKSAGM